MLKYVTFGVKVQLNVHDLNNEAVAGNVTDIRIMEFLDEKNERKEAPAVSGRMLKHWHYEMMRKIGIESEYNLPFCDACKIGEPVRPAILKDGKLSHTDAVNQGAEEIIKNCAICDTHGYLAAIGNISERRSSRAMFSWLMPVLESESTYRQVIHSRVKSGKDFKEEGLTSQMPFNKSYASGVYGFVSALDVERFGYIEVNNKYAIDDDKKKSRIKTGIEAYRHLISGQIGASLSHAIPHVKPTEILITYSEKGALPFPISPIYPDYIEVTRGLMPKHAELLYWGERSPEGVVKKNSIAEIFEELMKKVDEAK